MRLIAAPGVGLAPLRGRLNFPGHSLTLIAKLKLALAPGGLARVLTDAPSFPTGDEPYPEDELGLGTARYASDFVFMKPSAEVLVVGHFHAQDKKPVRASEVAVSIDGQSTRLCVIGRRSYSGSGRLPTAQQAEPFNRLALRWEHAFGGVGHTHNPVGTGYLGPGGPGEAAVRAGDFAQRPLELPRIERPDLLFTHLDQTLEPVCFAPRAASWPVRRNLFGSCDERWLKTRWPWLPEDFDARYFMSALPALQQPGYLRGDETLRFTHMHPELPSYQTSLPNLHAIAVVQRCHDEVAGEVNTEQVALFLDTLWVDMDNEVAQLVWRGSVPCKDADASDIRHAWVGLAPRTLALSAAEICARGAEAIAQDEAQWNITAATAPAPPSPAPLAKEEAGEPLDPIKMPPPWTRERVQAESGTKGALRGRDLSGLDLSGLDLAGVDLRGTLLSGVRLSRANLRAADLSGANLQGASLSAADLSLALLEDADLSGCHGQRVQLAGARLLRANLASTDFSELVFKACDLSLVRACGARLSGARFERCELTEADFEAAQLESARFENCTLNGARFVDAQLAYASFVDCVLQEADFERASLGQATLARCKLDDVLLEGVQGSGLLIEACSAARLRAAGADLSFAHWIDVSGADVMCEGASLDDARLHQCHLPGADLSAAKLARARITGCALVGAKFAKADLSDALLLGNDCFEASFEVARLLRCDGSGSSFFRAEFLDAELAGFHGQKRDLTGTKLAAAKG
jgi:uncharacterized protein YjbI with pentapeptide repeats